PMRSASPARPCTGAWKSTGCAIPRPTMPTDATRRSGRMPAFERRVLLGSWLVALPALLGVAVLLLVGVPDRVLCWVLGLAVVLATALIARWQHRRVVYPLYTAVLVFDHDARLRLLNPAAQRLLAGDRSSLIGRQAGELALDVLLAAPSAQVVRYTFPGRSGRFDIRHAPLRNEGRSGRLLVINDVGRVLREEERQAWQRLLRVLGHEVNNSLASIHSLAGTLATVIAREPLADDWREDAQGGLQVIGNRAESLARFLAGYSRLAALPSPQ